MNKTPKIRFKEFRDEWESKKLGDLTVKTGIKNKYNENYEVYSISNKYGFIPQAEQFENSRLSGLDKSLYQIVGKGEFAYNPARINVGSIGVLEEDKKVIVSSLYVCFRFLEQMDYRFFKTYVGTYKFNKDVIRNTEGSVREYLFYENFSRIKINKPKLEEQEKIASLFSLIDDKIFLQAEKVEALKGYKNGMMQKIFSRELRFKDDDGRDYHEWEEKKLGECIENKGGTALEKFADENGTHKFISIGNYSTDGKYIDSGQRISLNDKTKDKLLYKNNLVMVLNDKTSTGDLIGSTILIGEDDTYIYNQRSERLICNESIHPNFAWILLNYEGFRKKVFSIAQGGTQIYVNFPSVKDLKIQLPSLKEQNKIAKFILSLDNKLEKEQEKLDSLNEYKKGLLQQMFV